MLVEITRSASRAQIRKNVRAALTNRLDVIPMLKRTAAHPALASPVTEFLIELLRGNENDCDCGSPGTVTSGLVPTQLSSLFRVPLTPFRPGTWMGCAIHSVVCVGFSPSGYAVLLDSVLVGQSPRRRLNAVCLPLVFVGLVVGRVLGHAVTHPS